MHNPPPLTPRGMMLLRSLRSRSRIPGFPVVFGLLIVALANRGDAGGVAFPLLIILGPLLFLRWLLRR